MKNPKTKFAKLLKALPQKPGVYKMINAEGSVIYVGKAKDLKKRVNQYFQKSKTVSKRTEKLIENTENINYTVVDTELEALILELNLIKELHPKYNVLLKDDKNYVYIKITKEDFPRIQIVRKIDDKKATYYGPKTAKHKVEKTFKTLKKVFPFRHCTLDIEAISPKKVKVTRKTIKYPCLDHYIKRCAAPCISNCTKEEYEEIINNVKRFLEGHHEEIMKSLHKQMQQLAQNKDFEGAAKLRDRIKNIEEILEKQKISDPNQTDKDIFNYVLVNNKAFFNLFQVRDGKLINQENFALQAQSVDEEDKTAKEELLGAFLTQYYEKTTNLPKEILIPHKPSGEKALVEFISKEKGSKIKLIIPLKGEKSRLLEMSLKNAKIYADRNRASFQEEKTDALKELQKLLKLKKIPKRIECYDISHLAGTDTTGSMVVFQNGIPEKDMYRRFKVKTVQNKPNDYKSLEEILSRRFGYISNKYKDFTIKKPLKKDVKEILAINKDLDYKQLYVIKKKEKIVGLIQEKIVNETHFLTSLWISEKERGKKLGQKLIKHTIKKSKAKRLYLNCKEELTEYYEEIGFQKIKKVPKGLEKEHEHCESDHCVLGTTGAWFAFDKKKKKDKSFESKPDLIIIDGGKGQLSTAVKALNNLSLKIPIISIAKKEEEIFVPGEKTSIKLVRTSPVLKLVQQNRDEAHRFAISYNKNLREKRILS